MDPKIDARDDHTAVGLDDGRIAIFGGFKRGERTNELLIYDIVES